MSKYLIIDGMLNGTGIRDQNEGGYIDPESLKLSHKLKEKLRQWLKKYEMEHYAGYTNKDLIQELDREGLEISNSIKDELRDCKISYYSDANLVRNEI